ncbi:MAG: hypothetical protein KAI18_03285 [Candidatus Aenigmarchaeota archaeon]|nr:hypothetical protein [Candidatus Aenigmarchaeota archaeon]
MYTKKRKGISPLIAVVLLIVFTVAISTIIIGWMNDYTKKTTSDASENTDVVVACAKQVINIPTSIGVQTNSSGYVTVLVENIGQAETTIKQILAVDNVSNMCQIDIVNATIDIGDIGVFGPMDCSAEFGAMDPTLTTVRATTTCGGIADEWTSS